MAAKSALRIAFVHYSATQGIAWYIEVSKSLASLTAATAMFTVGRIKCCVVSNSSIF